MGHSEKEIWTNRSIRLFCFAFSGFAPELCSKLLYYKAFGRKLDLKNPKTLNEKLMWLKLNTYRESELITQCVDKYAVRRYIREQGCEEILNELIGVWDKPSEIPFSELPQRFVLKCNHGCGYNIICQNKELLDTQNVICTLNKWLREDFWRRYAEINYRKVPKKIICEAYITDSQQMVPVDYKFYCFNGRAKYVMACAHRDEAHVKYYFFNRDWQLERINPASVAAPPDFTLPKPARLEEMFAYADRLSAPFPFVRVDLYASDNRIIFGELTFTPAAALDTNRLPETDLLFGQNLEIPINKELL